MGCNRRLGKNVLSIGLAVLLVLQMVTFSMDVYAESVPNESGSEEVGESGLPEPSTVTEDVYDEPTNFTIMGMGSSDKTLVIMDANTPFPLEVIQDEDVVLPGGTIHGRKPFTIRSTNIRVPVKGDAPDPDTVDESTVILLGDELNLDSAIYFPEVILPDATLTLTDGSDHIGTGHFSETGIQVVFDGLGSFFNGQAKNVTFGFESTAMADVSGIAYGTSEPIYIFGTAYQLENPALTPAYSISLKSNSNAKENDWIYSDDFVEGFIEWQVDVAAMDAFDQDIPISLEGLTFVNALDPVAVGTYVEGSLQINDDMAVPDGGVVNALAYTFPPGFSDSATILFKTWIPKAKYYYEYNSGSSYQTVRNEAELRDASDDTLLHSNAWRVAFRPDWIQKNGTLNKREEPTDPRTITWTIDVNKNYHKQGLNDLTITDALPAGLDFISAKWHAWDSGINDWSETATPINPDANVFEFGDVDGPIRLVIESELTDSTTSFNNTATARWNLDVNTVQDNDTGVADSATVTIGAHTLTKRTVSSSDNLGLGIVQGWEVTLTPQEALPDAAVYDLLVYGAKNEIDFSEVTADPPIDPGILVQLQGLNGLEFQRYRNGSFQSDDGLTHVLHTLYQDGQPVADLVRVTGYNTDAAASFTFESLPTRWEHFASNANTTPTNQAYLVDDANVVGSNRPYYTINGGMLAKQMLYAYQPAGTTVNPANINQYISNDNNDAYTLAAYDQLTRTVTFRFSVNMNGLKTEQMAQEGGSLVASNIRLVDTLPEGWEFVPYSDEEDFLIYEGVRQSYGATVGASTLIADPGDLVSFSSTGNVGTFSFNRLDGPYVILVKARPTEQKLRDYFDDGGDLHEEINTAELKIDWGGEPSTVADTRKVIVPITTLGKSVTKPNPGVLEWTINYSPPFEMKDDVYLQDTLGEGLVLRQDEHGNLSLRRPDMAVYPAKLTPTGEMEKDGDALDLYDPNSEVQVEAVTDGGVTRLIIRMDDPGKFYQIVYQTEVTDVPASGKAGNEVKLMGDEELQNISAASEQAVDNSDIISGADTQGKLDVVKLDPDGNPLGGVIFTLYEPDGETVVDSKTTDADGEFFMLLDAGIYLLKQTYIDTNTYLPTTTTYYVRVASTRWNPIWVDGVEVNELNPLVVPTPIWETGNLKLETAIEGKGADPSDEFEYTITFSNGKSYSYSGDINGTVASGGTVKLKGGQSVTFEDIPDGITYTIVQTDYAGDGYKSEPENRTLTGNIVAHDTVEEKFVNTRHLPGKLTIDLSVTGNGADVNKPFVFTVTFGGPGADESYNYTISGGATGTLQSGDTITLKHGESVVIDGIPKDTTYTVTETDYAADGYTTNWPSWQRTGTIEEDGDHHENAVNTRMIYGGLLIGVTVEGSGADKDKAFEYTVDFPDAAAHESFTYTKSDAANGTLQSGDTITLKHGETIAIEGIPSGYRYSVSQNDDSVDGYTTDPVSLTHDGTIAENHIAEARFVNARYLPGNLTLKADPEVVPGDGNTPSQLTATLTDYEGKPVAGQEVVFELPDLSTVKATTDELGQAVIPYTPPKLNDPTSVDHLITAKVDSLTEGKLTATTKVTAVPAAITGVLRDNTTGAVIPNATVIITDETNGVTHEIETDADGVYFLPVPYGGEYTITFTQKYVINGAEESITFTQKAELNNHVTGGEVVPAHITAVGVVLLKKSDGQSSLLDNALAGNMRIYLKDASGQYVLDHTGDPKAFALQPNGAFSADGLSAEKYTMEVRYEFEPGKELTLIRDAELDVKANGELNISYELVDPYGIITDASTGLPIEGAKVVLYYADNNQNPNVVPGDEVHLPLLPGFLPNDNASPDQLSDENGAYAYMVYPHTDYYLVVTKKGYVTHISPTIPVGLDIVEYNLVMQPVSAGGGGGGGGVPGPAPNLPDPDDDEPGDDEGVIETGEDEAENEATEDGEDTPDTGDNEAEESSDEAVDNGDEGTGESGSDDAGNRAGGIDNAKPELDDVPKTGVDGASASFYLILALISLLVIGLCLIDIRRRRHNH